MRIPFPYRRSGPVRRAAVFLLLPALTAVAFGTPAAAGVGGDWPQWMGPRHSGAVQAPGVFAGERPIELEIKWRRQLAEGFSSVSVADGRAYTLATGEKEDLLVAFDAKGGDELWRLSLDVAGIEKASSTPAVGNGRVFAMNARGKLYAVAVDSGEPVWSRDLRLGFGAVPLSYGMSTSPLLVDDTVVVLVGGKVSHNLVAFDQASGEVVWSVFHAERGSYASPALLTIAGKRQIVSPADDRLYAVDPSDGSLLWSFEGLGYLDRIPLLLVDNRLFLAQERGAVMLRLTAQSGGWRVEEEWKTHDLKDSYSPAVHLDGSIYGFNGTFLTCLDAGTGEKRWSQQIGNGSLIMVDGHLLVIDAFSGRLAVIAARPDKFLERASVDAVTITEGAGSYASPSFADGRIYVRGGKEVVAVEIAR